MKRNAKRRIQNRRFNSTNFVEGIDLSTFNLSTRSRNIILELGGVEVTLKHYKKFQSFRNIRNSGSKSNIELIAFSEMLLNKVESDVVEFESLIKNDQASNQGVSNHVMSYYYLVSQLSVRAINVLESAKCELNTDDEGMIKLIVKEEIKFSNLRNCGFKTEMELDNFGNQIRQVYKRINVGSQNSELDPKLKLKAEFWRRFPSVPSDKIEFLFQEDKVDIKEVLVTAIYYNQSKHIKREVIRNYFFEEGNGYFDIAQKLGVTRERVRQIIKKFIREELPSEYLKLKDLLGEYVKNNNLLLNQSGLVIFSLKFYEDYIEERKYPNFKLETEVMKLVLPKSFQTFAEYLSGDLAMMKFINLEGVRGIYINTIRAEECNIKALLHWCKNEIFNLEKFNIEYDIEVLISRFYIENTCINLDDANLKFISEIIKKQKVSIEGTAEERRVLRDRRQFEILDLCYNFIVKKGQPVKTSVLVSNLLEMYLIVSKQEILKILNSRKDLFTTFGSGYWALSEWKSDGIVGGSIREIVFSLLFNSECPIHLSEILRIISKHRSITLRSLQTNLRFEENKLFKFYNCNFIGLNSKIYDQYWENLPKVNGTFFQIKVLRKLIEDGFDIPELYEKLYGYPPLNTQFLIDNAGGLR